MFQLRFVWKNLKGRRLLYVIGIFFSIVTAATVFINPALTKILVDQVINGTRKDLLIPILLTMCGIVLVVSILRYLRMLFFEWSSQHMLLRIRETLFAGLEHQEMRFFDNMRSGDIITRITGDIDMIRHVTAWTIYQIVESAVTFTSAVIFLSFQSYQLTLCLIAVLPIIFLVLRLYFKKILPLYQNLRAKLSDLNTAAQENIAGNRVVKAFAREEYEKEKFDEKSREFKKANLEAVYTNQRFSPILSFLGQTLTIITVLVGGLFVINGSITMGTFFAFSGLVWALSQPINALAGFLTDMQRFMASADKVIELYYARPTIVDRHDAVDSEDRIKGKIEFTDVSFKFENLHILENVSFSIEPGETVAIMGPTGCGKTTLISLLSRFFDVNEGKILIDGIDIRNWKLSKIRSSIAISTQDVFLFSDTVDSNIAYGNAEMPEDKVMEYAKAASADHFINKMEEKFETIIGERGVGLSGGQRQRIALARAIAVEPPILILDDTTSAVDLETEAAIQKALHNLPYPCTKIIIAQRISSVKNADKIIILKDSKIDVGTHETLAKINSYYRHICELQDIADLPAYVGGEHVG